MQEEVIVYHGTSLANYEKIKKEGLKPRYTRRGNWLGQNVGSHPKLVYLTSNPLSSQFYAFTSSYVNKCDIGVILKIDYSKIDKSRFRVDENYIDLIERNQFQNCPLSLRKKQRAAAFKDTRWLESLDKMKAFTVIGDIDPELITVSEEVDIKKHWFYLPSMNTIEGKTARSEYIKTLSMNFRTHIIYNRWWYEPFNRPIKDFVKKGNNYNGIFDYDWKPNETPVQTKVEDMNK